MTDAAILTSLLSVCWCAAHASHNPRSVLPFAPTPASLLCFRMTDLVRLAVSAHGAVKTHAFVGAQLSGLEQLLEKLIETATNAQSNYSREPRRDAQTTDRMMRELRTLHDMIQTKREDTMWTTRDCMKIQAFMQAVSLYGVYSIRQETEALAQFIEDEFTRIDTRLEELQTYAASRTGADATDAADHRPHGSHRAIQSRALGATRFCPA